MAWPESSPTFPKAWQAGNYLKKYIAKYKGIDIQTSSKVLKVSRSASTASSSTKRWKIEVEKKPPIQPAHDYPAGSYDPSEITSNHSITENSDQNGSRGSCLETHYFDYIVIGSGFFGKPKLPVASSSIASFTAPVQHSTQFRNVEALLQGTDGATRSQGSKILVVGGSISGAEVAASIAMQLSSHVHSPKTSQIEDASKYTVHHLVRRPFWVMPLFLPVVPMLETDANLSKVRLQPFTCYMKGRISSFL
jgi:hypothetical protein